MKYVFFVNDVDDITKDLIRAYVEHKIGPISLVCDNDKDRMKLIRVFNITIMQAIKADMRPRKKEFIINLCNRFIDDLIKDYFICIDIENNM